MKKFCMLLSAALFMSLCAWGQDMGSLFNRINREVLNEFAPDSRDKTYEVNLIEKGGKLLLVGSTTEKAAVEALTARLAEAGIIAENRIDLLPSAKLKGKTYGIV